MKQTTILQIDKQGRVVLPKSMRSKGNQYYTCLEDEDGSVHLIPVVGVLTAKQAYFWSNRWQSGEEEASRDLKKGRYQVVDPKKLKNTLDKI